MIGMFYGRKSQNFNFNYFAYKCIYKTIINYNNIYSDILFDDLNVSLFEYFAELGGYDLNEIVEKKII